MVSERASRAGPWTTVALLILIALVFANALGVGFVFDDVVDIADNPSAKADTFFERLPVTNRPLTKASYALNDAAHGPWPAGFAMINVAIHLVTALLALALIRRAGRGQGPWLGAAVIALWAIHPALTESVTYLSGRSMVLSGALMLTALVAATGPSPRPMLAFLAATLAPLARETALVLPLILLWWQWTVDAGAPRRMRRAWPIWAGTGIGAALMLAMPRHRDLIAFSLDLRDPITALRGNLHAATQTLSFWFGPWQVTILPEPPYPYAWHEPETLWRLALLAAGIGAALAVRRRLPLAAFGIGFTLLSLAPSQSLLWRADPVALKPLYLAGLGLCLTGAALAQRFIGPRSTFAAALILAVPLAGMTIQRNVLFASEIALFADAVQKTPEQGRAWITYAAALMGEARYDEAYTAVETGLRYDPADLTGQTLRAQLATIRGVE